MKFELAKTGNLLIVKVSGELDHHFADEIRIRKAILDPKDRYRENRA